MSKARILVVEDEAVIAMEIELILKKLGYEVSSVVNNSSDAIKKAEEENPDLILMDIRIQGDKDGIEASEIIRDRFSIPIIFSTAYLEQEKIDRAKITMPFGYILKPIQERDLKVTLDMALYVAKVDAKRKHAEEQLKTTNEELRIYQIELETQNEELREAQIEIERLRNKYEELYNYAPVGFITFNNKDFVEEANITCSKMLRVERGLLKNLSFTLFVETSDHSLFFHHKRKAIETKAQQSCTLTLIRKDNTCFSARLESKAVFDDKGEFVQMITNIIDVTVEQQ